jgi:AraC family transcriptional regulator
MSTGTTPHQYIMRKRVERAQEYLRTTKTALSEIATQVGFETQSHFTSVFRRLASITPKHYRDMHEATRGDTEAQERLGQGKSATAA